MACESESIESLSLPPWISLKLSNDLLDSYTKNSLYHP